MKIEIDQSGKIENTHKPTVIGFSNTKNKTIIIFATEKQKLLRYFRKIGKQKVFIYIVFATLICLLLKNEKNIDQIIIDKEYPGQEALIKNYLLSFFRKTGRDIDKGSISFRQIGKKSKAHQIVYQSYQHKRSDAKVTAKDVLKYFVKLKSGV